MQRDIIISDILLCHQFSAPPGWCYEAYRQGRRRHGLVYVLAGEATYQMTGPNPPPSFTAQKGDLLYFAPDASYFTQCPARQPFVHMTVNFQLQDGEAVTQLPTRCRLANGTKIQQLFTRLVRDWNSRRPRYELACLRDLYDLLYTVLQGLDHEHDSYRQKLRPALEYIENHACETFPIEDLANLCGMSETYFRRLFQRVYKETAQAYRSRLRIGRACDLLLSEVCSVETAARLCGYSDPAYFSRVFKKVTGINPSAYKNYQEDKVV